MVKPDLSNIYLIPTRCVGMQLKARCAASPRAAEKYTSYKYRTQRVRHCVPTQRVGTRDMRGTGAIERPKAGRGMLPRSKRLAPVTCYHIV